MIKTARKIAPLLICLVLSGCTSLFFHPTRDVQESPAVKLFPHRDVVFQASDGMVLHGWYFPTEVRGLCAGQFYKNLCFLNYYSSTPKGIVIKKLIS